MPLPFGLKYDTVRLSTCSCTELFRFLAKQTCFSVPMTAWFGTVRYAKSPVRKNVDARTVLPCVHFEF